MKTPLMVTSLLCAILATAGVAQADDLPPVSTPVLGDMGGECNGYVDTFCTCKSDSVMCKAGEACTLHVWSTCVVG